MKPTVETYKNEDGEVAVLVSCGYGAGWSTWNPYPELAYDKRVIEMFLRLTKTERAALACLGRGATKTIWARQQMEKWGYKSIYWGGFYNCRIEWVPAGKPFRITEYDGAEDIEYLDTNDWMVF